LQRIRAAQIAGELIYANLFRLHGGENQMTVVDYYQPDQPEIVVALNEHLTPSQNAQRYFKRYQKLKSKFETVSGLLANELTQSEYLEGIRIAIVNAESDDDINALKYEFSKVFLLSESYDKDIDKGIRPTNRPKSKGRDAIPSEPRRFLSSDGLEILVGRNNIQNEYITFHIAAKDDIWLHVQKAPGTHTIIRSGKVVPPDRTIEEAAMLTAWYSRRSEARDTKSTVDYCSVADVRKQKNSTPGHVLYKNFQSVTVYARLPESVIDKGVQPE
jgi:predicted ribosome quality control (RQC) complex YloA/Tae2 family protein